MASRSTRVEKSELVQTRIGRQAAELLRKRADGDLRSVAAYLRKVIYQHLGLQEE